MPSNSGSILSSGQARRTWFLKRAGESPDGRTIAIGLFNRKTNNGPLRPALGFEFTFEDSRTRVRRVEVAAIEDFAPQIPLWQRMVHLLRSGPQTVAAIANELEAKTTSIEKAVQRSKNRLFTRVDGPDGVSRVALVERRAS